MNLSGDEGFISVERHVETFDDIYKKNAAISIERLFKYVQNSSKNSVDKVRIILYSPQPKEDTDNLIETFLNNTESPSVSVLFIGAEEFEDYPKIGLLKHFLNGRYIKAPFNITEFLIHVNNLVSVHPPLPSIGEVSGGAELKPPGNLVNKLCEFLGDNDIKVFGSLSREAKFKEISDLFFNKNRSRGKEQHGVHDIQKQEKKATKIEELNKKHDYCEFVYAMGTKVFERKLKILIIDNNPNSLLDDIKIIAKYYKEISFSVHVFEKKDKESYSSENIEEGITYKNIKKDNDTGIIYVEPHINSNERETQGINNFDLILLDLNLTDDDSIKGEDILNNLYSFCPEIPVFILSSIEDTLTIRKTLFTGADDYIPKSRLISLPFRINKYFEEIGKIIWLIEDKDLRRNLIGNLRRWRFNKEILWFGDKCYHMINHGYNHAENDWKLLNQIFPKFNDLMAKKGIIIPEEDIYCLCMATWLHDIGHAGNEQYGEPHLIRDAHSVISAEIILKHPEHYGIFGYEDDDKSPYRYVNFRRPKTVLQYIRERIFAFSATLTLFKENRNEANNNIIRQIILDKIALMCIYHSSKFPMDDNDIRRITKKKSLSLECYENLDRKTDPIHLSSIVSFMGNNSITVLTGILRITDALDHNKNRVGNDTSRSIKLETIRRDTRCQLLKLEREVNLLINSSKMNPEKAKRFRNLFFDKVENNILDKKGMSDKLKEEQRNFLDSYDGMIDTTNYELLLEHIQFICVQDGHFDLHNAIESVDIKTELRGEKIILDIQFVTNKDKEYLDTTEVKKWDEENGKVIHLYLLGKKLCKENGKVKDEGYEGYVEKELISSKDYLQDIFDIDNHKVSIVDLNKNELFSQNGG